MSPRAPTAITARQRHWAIVRLSLGVGQMMGASTALLLLIQTGMNPWSLGAVVVTCVLTGASVFLFGDRSKLGGEARGAGDNR